MTSFEAQTFLEGTLTETPTEMTERIASWLNRARDLAGECGCPQAVEPVLKALQNRNIEHLTLVVTGSPNAGKSSMINQMLARQLLPVSIFSGSAHEFVVQPVARATDERVAGKSGPIPSDKLDQTARAAPAASSFLLTVADPWLSAQNLRIMETLLDATDEDIESRSEEYLKDADFVLLVIDALTPLRRSESGFLGQCVRRSIPVAVFLAKGDLLEERERADVLDFVRKHVDSISADLPVLGCLAKDASPGLAEVKSEIERMIVNMDVALLRNLRVAQALLSAARVIEGGAEAGQDAQQKSQADRKKQQERRRAAIESQSLIWMQIEQALDSRRQRVTGLVRDHLASNRDTIIESLQYELDRTPDVKLFWERDLPFRLQRELRSVAGQATGVVNRQLGDDLKWLQDVLRKQFNYSLPLLGEPGFAVDPVTAARPDLEFADLRKFSVITRIGTVAAVIGTGTLLVTAGAVGIPMAISVGVGLLSEQVVRWHSDKDKEKVRAELCRIVQTAELEFARAVSESLRGSYGRIIADLKDHQARWYQAQVMAATAVDNNTNKPVPPWAGILQATKSLMAEIQRSVSQ
jgi:GTP-binding protein EngB required for normal cell division